MVLIKKHQNLFIATCVIDHKKLILGPLLFNIDICDLFFIDMSSDIANYADDTTPYECAPYYNELKENLESTICKIFN